MSAPVRVRPRRHRMLRIAPTTYAAHAAASALLRLVNAARTGQRLPVLRSDPQLKRAARVRVHETTHLFDHRRPSGTLGELLQVAGAPGSSYGENLALIGGVDVDRAVREAHRGLLDSPGHRANILGGGYRWIGVAAREHQGTWYFVQLFSG